MIVQQASLQCDTAAALCEAACAYAAQHQLTVCAWVLDSHGNPLAMQRHNQAPLASTEIARRKAWTAVSFKLPTDRWEQRLHDKPHLRASLMQQQDLALFGGGLPIVKDGQLLGAIGVSGASEAQDIDCAQAALAALD